MPTPSGNLLSTRHSTFKALVLLVIGEAAGRGVGFIENVIVARLLAVEDLGTAAIFASVVSFLGVVSDLSVNLFLVQAADGDAPQLQAASQFISMARGLGSALLLLALAWPIAMLFGISGSWHSIEALALVPLLRGLSHQDLIRQERALRFAPAVLVDLGSRIVVVGLAYPACRWFQDYRAVVWLLILETGLYTAASQLVARRRYSLAFDPVTVKRILKFGSPLLVNGILIFLSMQVDRLIVGTFYGMRELGLYFVALMLTVTPMTVVAGINARLSLPLLVQAKTDDRVFRTVYHQMMRMLSMVSSLAALAYILTGSSLPALLFGRNYAASGRLVALLGVAQAVRLLRAGPTRAAIARAQTSSTMVASAVRTASMTPMLIVAALRLSLESVAIVNLASEVISFWAAIRLLKRRCDVPYRETVGPVAVLVATAIAAATAVAVNVPAVVVAISGLVLAAVACTRAPQWGQKADPG